LVIAEQNLAATVRWPLAVAAAVAILLWPAIYNGFPMVFPDTGAYLSVAWGHYWTMDRSGFYGFFFRPLSFLAPLAQLWLGLTVQAAVIAITILVVCWEMLPRRSLLEGLGVIGALAVFTSLPWHAAQLMPDAFTGVVVLASWLACSRNLSETGTPTLWFATFLTGLLHYTHIPLIIAAVAGTLAIQLVFHSSPVGSVVRRAGVAAAVVVAIIGTQVAANGVFLKRWSPAPMGVMFLFARLHEDGLIAPWLSKHCNEGDTPVLCRSEAAFPRDSQELLWGNRSPFLMLILDPTHKDTNPEFLAELRKASYGSILQSPLRFGGSAAEGGFNQFIRFRVLDDECPSICRNPSSALDGWFRDLRPSLLKPLFGSRQLRGDIPKRVFRTVTTPVAAVLLLLVPLAWCGAVRRQDYKSCTLLSAIMFALITNAAVSGALSGVHDRYQSRLIWTAPLGVLLVLLRWHFTTTALLKVEQRDSALNQ